MSIIPTTRGNPQATDVAVENATPLLGGASREDLQTVVSSADANLAKLYEDTNILLTNGGLLTYTADTLTFTENLKLHINSQVAGGAPTIIDLGATTRAFTANNKMLYAVIDRIGGTATVTADASTLPAVVAANTEVILLAKRVDDGTGSKRLYLRDGMALNDGQAAKLGSAGGGSGSGTGDVNYITNPSAAVTTADWFTSNAGVITVTKDITAADLPRSSTTGTGLKFTYNSSAAGYAYTRFKIDPVDKNRPFRAQWAQNTLSGYVDGDLQFEVWTNTASNYGGTYTQVGPAIEILVGEETVVNQFTSAITDDYYEIRIKDVVGSASAVLSDIIVGPQRFVVGVNPIVYSKGIALASSIGTVGQLRGGHRYDARSYPYGYTGNGSQPWVSEWFAESAPGGLAPDTSGNGHTLNWVGSPVFTAINPLGAATAWATDGVSYLYNSTDTFISTPDPANSIYLGGWFKSSDWSTAGSQILFVSGNDANTVDEWAYYVQVNSAGSLNWYSKSNDGVSFSNQVTGSLPTSGSDWVNVAVYFEAGGLARLLVNGEVVDTHIHATGPYLPSGTPQLTIGAIPGPNLWFLGSIWGITRIYHTGLSDTNLRKLAAARLDHNKDVAPNEQDWLGNVYDGFTTVNGQGMQMPGNTYIIDKNDRNSLYLSLDALTVNQSFDLSLRHNGFSASSIPVSSFEELYSSNPPTASINGGPLATIPHGLARRPQQLKLLQETGTPGIFEPIDFPEGLTRTYTPTISAGDFTNNGFAVLTGKWYRDGRKIKIAISFEKDATPGNGSSAIKISLPTNFYVGTVYDVNILLTDLPTDANALDAFGTMFYNGSTVKVIEVTKQNADSGAVVLLSSLGYGSGSLFEANSYGSINFELPVREFSANPMISADDTNVYVDMSMFGSSHPDIDSTHRLQVVASAGDSELAVTTSPVAQTLPDADVVLTSFYKDVLIMAPTTNHTVQLPIAVAAGRKFTIINNGTATAAFIDGSSNVVRTVYPGTEGSVIANMDSPPDTTGWDGVGKVYSNPVFSNGGFFNTASKGINESHSRWWRDGRDFVCHFGIYFSFGGGVGSASHFGFVAPVPAGLTYEIMGGILQDPGYWYASNYFLGNNWGSALYPMVWNGSGTNFEFGYPQAAQVLTESEVGMAGNAQYYGTMRITIAEWLENKG